MMRLLPLAMQAKFMAVNRPRSANLLCREPPLLLAFRQEFERQPGEKGQVDKDSHPAQAGLADEKGHGQVESQDSQVKAGTQQG